MITLSHTSSSEFTLISNLFIDHYMPEANGEFVKVYLYLVRTLSAAPVSFSLEQMADHLLCTERDLLRALKYWAKTDLLSLTFDEKKQLTGITLHAPKAPYAEEHASVPESPQAEIQPAEEKKTPAVKKSASLSPSRVRELKQNEEIIQLLYIAEQYLGKTLTSTEMQKLLYFYDELKMSPALIEYLIEYCVGKNHRSIRYIETVALAWTQEGITTVEEAKAASALYGKDYFTILKYLGITGRNPVEDEVSFMDTWMKTYGFSMEIIQEACRRTILKTSQPSFPYTDRILKDWKEHDVHTLIEIQTLDKQHQQNRAAAATAAETPAKPQKAPAAAPNRFNNIPQHDYNYDEIERLLLNR